MVPEPLYNPCGGDLALDFTNSIGRRPGQLGRERLTDYAALVRWSREAGSLPVRRARDLERAAQERAAPALAVLARARALREALFAVFWAELQGDRPPAPALATLNAELERALAHARLERARDGWAWTWADDGALDAPLWPVARAAAELLVAPDRQRVKECASDDCLWLFVDRTRNHGRRWCEMKGCGNLAKVRRHRRRRREQGTPGSAKPRLQKRSAPTGPDVR